MKAKELTGFLKGLDDFDIQECGITDELLKALDAKPVVHGHWISVEDDVLFKCSRCDSEISTDWDYDQADMWNYCPHCGAKMNGGINDE